MRPGALRRRLVVLIRLAPLALCLAPGATAANVVEKALHGGELACEPAWPFFCGNIHVACAGQTTLRAFDFTLRVSGDHARLTTTGDDDGGVARRFARARVAEETGSASILLLPEPANGYLKLQADGRYSLRHYLERGSVMSWGRCR